MKSAKMSTIMVLALGLMVWLAGAAGAAPMGTAFTYQGRLIDANSAADGLYDFQFRLYDSNDPCTGTQQGSTIDINDLDVIDGHFIVELDFGSGIFDGNAVWLETTVAHGDGNDPCTLKPRVELTPTPYALYAASVAFPLELAGSSDDPIISATNSGAGKGIYAEAAGIYSTAVYGIGTHESGRGVWGDATGTYGIGVRGVTTGDYGLGVYGLATGSDGHGTVGRAWGSSGRGVYGEASNEGEVENYGGYFVAHGKEGRGVYGEATYTHDPENPYPAPNYGGYFKAAGIGGQGVYGEATYTDDIDDPVIRDSYGGYFKAANLTGCGVYGEATGIVGTGVYGVASNSGDGQNHGGYFKAAGEDGRGVYGAATNDGDVENYGGYFRAYGTDGRGVYGTAHGKEGRGVYGEATYTDDPGNPYSAPNYGGYFKAAGIGGRGVYGVASNSGDVFNTGGYFRADGARGWGVYGLSTGSNGKGVQAWGKQYDFCAAGFGIDYGSTSSIRWKGNIRAIDNPLDKILQLRGVYFDWDAEHGGHHDVGMIAEEVGEVMPEIVVYEENGIDANGMDYSKLTPLLVEAVKELKAENDSLKVRVEALERTMLQLAEVKELEL
ncbi:MAG: tail fiber domain-containing protein [Sedimentisphaerales bacterium]